MNAPVWRRSTRSDTSGNACVEVAALPGGIGIRDSKNPVSGHHTISRETFGGLVESIKNDDLNL